MSQRDDLSKAVRVVGEYLAQRPLIRRRLEEQVNAGMKAQNLEGIARTRTHEVVDDEELSVPAVTDRTGEAAIRSDRARRLLAELDQAEGDLLASTMAMTGKPLDNYAHLLRSVHDMARPLGSVLHRAAQVFDRALGEVLGKARPQVDRSMDGAPGCQCCSRLRVNGVPLWSDPDYNKGHPTDLGGGLKAKLRLCRSCQRFAVNQEPTRLPTLDELRHRHNDPAGRWPRRHAPARRAS